jgi:hypothetical protein
LAALVLIGEQNKSAFVPQVQSTPAFCLSCLCVLANQFKRKENVIFRIRVRNTTAIQSVSTRHAALQTLPHRTGLGLFATTPAVHAQNSDVSGKARDFCATAVPWWA